MIKKELGVFRRVPGSSDQNTDLDITLTTAHVIIFHIAEVNIPMELGADWQCRSYFRTEVTRAEH